MMRKNLEKNGLYTNDDEGQDEDKDYHYKYYAQKNDFKYKCL